MSNVDSSRAHWALGVAIGAVVFYVTLVSFNTQVLASQDLYLHISVGRWILNSGHVPDHGIFSGSMPEAPWVAHEWLASVGFAYLYDHLGWGGVLAATSLMLALAIGVLTFDVARTLGPLVAIALAVLSWGLCINHLVARPHVAALPLMVIWLAAHARARRKDRAPPLVLALVMTLWANLHGSFMFGLAFTLLFAAEAVFEAESPRQARGAAAQWGLFLGAAVLAAAITPQGPGGLLFPLQMMGLSAALGTVNEWQPSTVINNAPLYAWFFLLLFVSLLQGVRVPICRLAMFMLLLYMALAHRRHAELLGLATPILLQHVIAEKLSAAPSVVSSWGAMARPAVQSAVAGIALSVACLSAVVLCRDVTRGPDKFTPSMALNAVEARGIKGPVLNAQNFGGYMIFRGYRPFIDGRVDMYGNEFMLKYTAVDQLPAVLEQYHIAWTIFEPSNPRTILMDHLTGWSRIYADSTAVVYLRQAGASHQPR